MRSAGCIVIFTIFIERPEKSILILAKCIALINNERADINIERADGRSDGALVNMRETMAGLMITMQTLTRKIVG